MGRITLFLLVFVLIGSLAKGQLLVENFDYGASEGTSILSVGGSWVAGTSGTEPNFTTSSLSFHTSYPSQGVGGALKITTNNTRDIYKNLQSAITNSTDIYVSFLVNFQSTPTTEGYFLCLAPSVATTATYKCSVYVKQSGTGYILGLTTSNAAGIIWEATTYSYNQTYCVAVYYKFSTVVNDYATMFVFDGSTSLPSSMPSYTPLEQTSSLTNEQPSEIGSIVIQSGAFTPTGYIDGIRVGTTWAQAPLPVELTSFTAKANPNSIILNWSTATEVENYGFEIERATQNGEFQKIGFVSGAGNSNATKDYTYTDTKLATGKYSYRLKQMDISGTYEYSNIIQTEILPTKFELMQNYPNPFNPSTTISFAIAEGSQTRLEILNPLGESVATLVDGNLHAGTHVYQWDGTRSPSGVYMARLITPTQSKTIKMLLVK